MSVSVKKLISDVVRKYNGLSTGKAKDFRNIDIVDYINDATEIIIEAYISQEDQNRFIKNVLKDLTVRPKDPIKCKSVDENCCIVEYPEDHCATSVLYIDATHSCCDESKRIEVVNPQSDDRENARKNPYRQSNFFFEQALGDEAENGHYIYHDCKFKIKNVWLEYIRNFKRVQIGSLVSCEGDYYKNYCNELIVGDVDFELDKIHIKVTDLASYLMATAARDIQFSQAKLNEIINLKQLYK